MKDSQGKRGKKKHSESWVRSDKGIKAVSQDLFDKSQEEITSLVRELQESERRYRDLYEEAPNAYFSVGVDGNINQVNRSATELLGYSADELIGKPVLDLYADTPTGKEKAGKVFQGFLAGGNIQDEELEMCRADGSKLWISLSVRPVHDLEGKVIYSRSTVLDISERKQRERELRDSALSYGTLLGLANRAKLGIAVAQDKDGTQGKLVFVNEECARISGYTEEELLGMTFGELLPQRMLPWLKNIYAKRQSGEAVISYYEAAILTKSVDEIDVEISADVMVYDGKLATIIFVRDISERRHMEEVLKVSERRYKTLVDTANRAGIGMAVLQDRDNKQGKFVFVNEECSRISGYTEDELLDMTFEEVLPQSVFPRLIDNYRRRQSGEKVAPFYEAAFLTKRGEEITIEISADVTVYEGNLATIAFFRDITERKRVEREFARQTTVLSTVMENTGTLLVYLDLDFNFVMANKAYIDSSKYTWEELEGKNIFNFFPGEAHEAVFRMARDTGETFFRNDMPISSPQQPSHGITYWDSTLVPVKDETGKVTGIVLSLIETTERKKMEQMKDEFIALVSHELRTPITIISGSLQLTKVEGLSIEEKQDLIQNAIDTTDNLFDMLENMLELNRHQTGRLMLNTALINMGSVIKEVVDKMKNTGVRQRFHLEIPEVLPLINADRLRIKRILINLIENAVKYSPADSEIKIAVQSGTDFMVTSVIDQGKGIPKGKINKLFQMFEPGTAQEMIHGAGLGLAVCKRLVEAHGGWIEAESEPELGATFSFGLPLKP